MAMMSDPPHLWECNEVYEWIQSTNSLSDFSEIQRQYLGKYFQCNGIDGVTLLSVTPTFLTDLNLPSDLPTTYVQNAIYELYDSVALSEWILSLDSSFPNKPYRQHFLANGIDLATLHIDPSRQLLQSMGITDATDLQILDDLCLQQIAPFLESPTDQQFFAPPESGPVKYGILDHFMNLIADVDKASSLDELKQSIGPVLGVSAQEMINAINAMDGSALLTKMALHESSLQSSTDPSSDAIQKYNIIDHIVTDKLLTDLGSSLLTKGGCPTLKGFQLQIARDPTSLGPLGYPNMEALMKIGHELKKSYRLSTDLTFIVADVDSFYQINELYSREAGDAILTQIAEALYSVVGQLPDAMFFQARHDRFFVIAQVANEEAAVQIGQQLVGVMRSKTFEVVNPPVSVSRTISVGAYLRKTTDSMHTVRTNAHKAMFLAKKLGKNRVCTYTEVMKAQQWSPDKRLIVWSKQLYDLVVLSGQKKPQMCRQLAKRFLTKGASLDWQNPKENNNTVIMYSIENEFAQLVQYWLLMEWNGDVTRTDGSNALLLAIKHDFSQSIVCKIVQRTKQKNITNSWKENCLELAKAKGMLQVAKLIESSS